MIYICIPVFNRIEYTKKCIQKLGNQSFKDYLVVVCDDGSTDGTFDILTAEYPEVKVLKGDGNLWWSGATNVCVRYALQHANPGDFVFTLNNDTELAENTLETLINFSAEHPGSIVACGNYFLNDRSKLEATAFVEKKKWIFSIYHHLLFPYGTDVADLSQSVYQVHSLSGKGVLIPIEVFQKIGLYNEKQLPQYHGDTEFTRRAHLAGFKLFYNLNAVIHTDQHATGIGQANSSRISVKEFLQSFFSLRSENHLTSLYHRSRLTYGNKWPIYLTLNVLSIFYRFLQRYLKSMKRDPHTNAQRA